MSQWELKVALEYINKAINLDPTNGNHAQRGYIYYKMDNYIAAMADLEECFNKFLKIQPEDTDALVARGAALWKKKTVQSLEECKRLHQLY